METPKTVLIRHFDYLAVIIRNDATEKYTCYTRSNDIAYSGAARIFFLEGQNGICHFSKHILSRVSGGPMVPRKNFEIRVSETAFPAFLEHFGAKYEGLKSQF